MAQPTTALAQGIAQGITDGVAHDNAAFTDRTRRQTLMRIVRDLDVATARCQLHHPHTTCTDVDTNDGHRCSTPPPMKRQHSLDLFLYCQIQNVRRMLASVFRRCKADRRQRCQIPTPCFGSRYCCCVMNRGDQQQAENRGMACRYNEHRSPPSHVPPE